MAIPKTIHSIIKIVPRRINRTTSVVSHLHYPSTSMDDQAEPECYSYERALEKGLFIEEDDPRAQWGNCRGCARMGSPGSICIACNKPIEVWVMGSDTINPLFIATHVQPLSTANPNTLYTECTSATDDYRSTDPQVCPFLHQRATERKFRGCPEIDRSLLPKRIVLDAIFNRRWWEITEEYYQLLDDMLANTPKE